MWYPTFARHQRCRLNMRHIAKDRTVKHVPEAEGLSVFQVDDTLLMGTKKILAGMHPESKAFPSKGRQFIGSSPVGFHGTCFSKTNDGYPVDPRWVTRSALAAVAFELYTSFDKDFALHHLLTDVFQQSVSLNLYINSQNAWDLVISFCATTEKRLLVDIFSLHKAYRTGVMSNICCIGTGMNPADSMTKVIPSPT